MASYVDIAKSVLASMRAGVPEASPKIEAEPPTPQIFPGTPESYLTKPSGVGFCSATLWQIQKIEATEPVKPTDPPPMEESLKGQAVELWRDGSRFFLVADESDAHEAMGRFGRAGEKSGPGANLS